MASDVRDKPYSWIVAVAGCFMYFIMYGLGRTTGLLFVETLVFFDTDRETASFPFTLACALRYLSGPLAGALAGRVGLRLIILLGSIMACIGVGGCYLATTITAISVLWGGLFGLGSGISSTQLPQVNNLYFTKHLTKANGISYAGAAIAGFVLPPIIECLLRQYGISGTYLLLSAIALHAIPAAILLKEPETEKLPMISFEIPEEIRENYRRRLSSLSFIYDSTKRISRRLSQRLTSDILRGGATHSKNEENAEMGKSDKSNSFSTTNKSNSSNHNSGSIVRGKSSSFSFSESILRNKNESQKLVIANIQYMLPFKKNKTASLTEIKEGEPLEIKNTVVFNDEVMIACPELWSARRKSKSFSHSEVTIPNLQIPQNVIALNLQTIPPFMKTITESLSEIKENELLETKDIRRTWDSTEPQFSIISRHASICSRSSYEKRDASESFTNSEGKNELGSCYIECTEDPGNPEQPSNMCLNDISIFWDIKFFLISFTGSINGFLCFVLPAILIDFCMDKGISTTYATYIMMAFSICDMVGRVGFGWVTDNKYMTRANFCAACFFVLSASLALFVFSSGLIPMFFVLSMIGLSLGVHTPLPTGLISEYIDASKHTMANASFDVLGVPFLLFTPAMLGYFRDGLGSYDLFVYLLCVISFLCGLMMLLLPYIQRREQQKKVTAVK